MQSINQSINRSTKNDNDSWIILLLCLIGNISSKIVSLEKGVVIYGANALSLLPVVLFVLPINVHV